MHVHCSFVFETQDLVPTVRESVGVESRIGNWEYINVLKQVWNLRRTNDTTRHM